MGKTGIGLYGAGFEGGRATRRRVLQGTRPGGEGEDGGCTPAICLKGVYCRVARYKFN